VWFVGQVGNYLAYLDPASGQFKRFAMPDPAARDPHTLVFDRNGDIWFSGRPWFVEMPAGGSALLYAMAADDKNRIWFVETGPQPNRIVGFDAATEKFLGEAPITESGGLTGRHREPCPDAGLSSS
jgi:virginiamycin B lyase